MTKALFMEQNLLKGEIYAGLLLGENGAPDAHIFLLPGEIEDADWNKAMAWAEKIGGSLPTRREQRLLFANAKAEFKAAWYWSCEQHADNSADAWHQYFNYGLQLSLSKSFAGRARAVRRLTLQ